MTIAFTKWSLVSDSVNGGQWEWAESQIGDRIAGMLNEKTLLRSESSTLHEFDHGRERICWGGPFPEIEGAWFPGCVARRLPTLGLRRASDWAVLVALLIIQGRDGSSGICANITSAGLAEWTGYSKVTVDRAIRRLKAKGLVTRQGVKSRLICKLFDREWVCFKPCRRVNI